MEMILPSGPIVKEDKKGLPPFPEIFLFPSMGKGIQVSYTRLMNSR